MNKAEYLQKLEQKLRVLPEDERRDALNYHDEYISDAGDENTAISQLGTPGEVAAIILAQSVSGEKNPQSAQNPDGPKESAFSGMKTAMIVILSLFALPLAFPVVITVASIGFALVITLATLVFTFAVTGAALLFAGAAGILFFPFLLFQNFGHAMFLLGNGLISVGLGILLIKLTVVVMRRGFPAISRFVSKKILRRVDHEKNRLD
ncbi:MAG: DUF1700 domain-containing protein [Defluviitaleaceae bacterium]|nr:DUF1700 domain-containing protein [Defluviitaleaceae bacterium]